MLRKIRKNYKRLVAFFLSAAMIISNVGGNVGTVFAAEEQEERESAIFMVDGREILEAIQGLDGQEAFSKEDLEEMGLETGRKGILKKYEKLLLPEKGKVYALALDINTELALEGTALQAFYNTETKEVIFLYLNESSQAVDFYVNIDGYETKLVTVEANDANAAAGQPEAEEGREEAEKNAGGTSGGGTGESANDGSKDASETSEEGSKEAESTSGESASENESSGEAAEEGSKEDAPSAEQPEEKGTEDGSNGSDKASEDGSKADESKEESNEGSEAEDKGKDESEDKGQAEDGTDSVKEDGEKSDSDKKETEDSKQEDGNADKESNDKGNAGKPNDTASDDGSSKESGEAKEESGDKADHEADGKDEGKSEEDGSKKDDADKADQADGDSEGKGNAGSEGEKTSDDKSDDGSVKEDSADKADDQGAKEEGSADKGEDRSSDEGKSDSDGADSDSGDRHERNTLSLSMSIHQAAIVAIPADEIEGEAEAEEETTAVEEKEEEPEETTTAAEVTEEETEEKTIAPEVTEEETEEKTTAAAETEEAAEKETTTAAAETEETIKEETEAAQPEETTEIEKATETEAEKESEAETTVKAEEAAGETTEKVEDTSEEATEAKTEEETKPEETTTEAAKAEGSGQGASDGAGNSSQEITDDWEISGKAYDTVTIQETINARAYCVAIEDVKKIVEANQGIEAIETILAAAKTYTAETDDAEFTVGVPEGAFAEEVELRAVKIEDEAQLKEMADQAEGALEEGKTVSGIVAYDLSFVSLVSGEEVEPAKAVSVNIRMKEPVALSQEDQEEENAADGGVSVVHLPDGGEAEVVAEAGNGQETNFAFEAESFSDFVLVRTALKAGVESDLSLEDAIKKAIDENEGVLVLDKGYTASSPITIDKDLTIDLNGQTITYTEITAEASKPFLTADGVELTIQDSSDEGKIFSDVQSLEALIKVQNGGTLTIEGGTFESDGGTRAVFADASTFVMTGGCITNSGVLNDNGNVGSSGGGVLLIGSEFTMSGGSIRGNKGKLGGGIYATGNSTVKIKGSAVITENVALTEGGGIHVRGGSNLTVEENVVISKNTADAGGAVYGNGPCKVEVKESVTLVDNVSKNGGAAVQGTGQLLGILNNQDSLKEDLEISETQNITKPTVINLNGHTLTYTGNDVLYHISGSGSLTIKDEAVAADEALAAADGIGGQGTIISSVEGLDCLIKVEQGGALTITGGTLTNEKGIHAVSSNGGTVTMDGNSRIVNSGVEGSEASTEMGDHAKYSGGGIYANGGSVTVSGNAEISGNRAADCGGGICALGNAKVTISGDAKISHNTAYGKHRQDTIELVGKNYEKRYGGGGIFGEENTTIMLEENCSVEYNDSKATEGNGQRGGGYNGGGGIFSLGKVIMNGGKVLGNTATDAGGGIYSAGYPNSKFTMNGGSIRENSAHNEEGGGLRIDYRGEITSGDIIGNTTETTFNWGGGGIFITTGGELTITNLLVTNNDAEGFGGGVGGCSSGDVQVYNLNGAAVYDNHAKYDISAGTYGLTERAGAKMDDHTVVENQEIWDVFKEGYQDFYCAGESTVHGKMLGGGDARWIGSYNGNKSLDCSPETKNKTWGVVEISSGSSKTAKGWMALTARPGSNDKTKAISQSAVKVMNNYSRTHGGGIMSNGRLILGKKEDVPEKGSLIISKKAGGFPSDASFEFNVELKDAQGSAVSGSYSYRKGETEGTLTFNENGSLPEPLKLKDGEFLTILGLTPGTKFTVTETGANVKYETTVEGTDGDRTEIDEFKEQQIVIGGKGSIGGNVDSTVTFTNKPYTGELEISKEVKSEGELTENNKTDSFKFTVTLTTKDGSPLGEKSYSYTGSAFVENVTPPPGGNLEFDKDGKADITLTHGQKITISGLPVGTVYQVEEMPYDGYSVILPDNTQGTIAEKDGEITVAFTNQMETGKLSIQKIVTGEKGDKTKDFNFTITLTKDGKPLTGTYPYTGIAFEEGAASPSPSQGSLTLADGQAEISLKHGQRITLSGIPAGTSYTVTEREAGQDGYTTNKTDAEGTIVNDGEKTAEFVNNKPDTPEESTTETESTTEPDTSESESTTEPSTSETEPTTEPSTTPEESSPTEEPTTPQEPTTPEPTPSESPENPTTPSRPSGGGGGGGGRDRDRNPSVTPEPTPIPQEEVPLANIDPENVPLAMMPSENPTETMVIDDESVPLFGLPKTGDRSASTGALLGVVLLSLMAACGIHMKKRKEEE